MSHQQPSQNGPAVPPTLPLTRGGRVSNSSSPSNSHTSTPSHGAGTSNGSSYIVLGSHSSGARSPNDFSMVGGTGSPISLTDVTLEQALTNVQELAMENKCLREYLRDNNENIRTQYKKLQEWQAKVRDNNQLNLHKLQEYGDKIRQLEKDNQRLKQQITSAASGQDQGSLVAELQERIDQLTEGLSEKENKMCKLKEKVKDLEQQLSSPCSEGDAVFVHAVNDVEEVDRLQRYNGELERRCTELELKVQNFHQQNEQLMADLLEVQKLKQNLQEENSNLIQENVEAQKRMQAFLGDIKQTKHSIGPGVTPEHYGHAPPQKAEPEEEAEEQERQESATAQKDIQILEMQLVAGGCDVKQTEEQKLEEFNMSEITSDLRDKLDEERTLNSQQKQIILDKEAQIVQLEAKLKEREQMLSHYKEQLENQVAEVKQQHQQQQQELLRQLDGLNSELYKAKSSMSEGADVQSLKSQVLTLIKEVHESSATLDHRTKALEKKSSQVIELEQYNHRLSEELQKQRLEGDALITSLRNSLTTYESTLMKERGEHLTTKRQLNEMRASFNQLVTDYKDLLDTFDSYKSQQQQLLKEQQSNQVPKNVMDQINQLTAQAIAAEEAITYRDEEIKKLTAENRKMKEELDDTVPILRAQAEVWRQDFDAEREARERQHMEKESLLQEMKNLELRNQQLLDEIENQSRHSLAEMQRRHAPNTYQQQMQQHLQGGNQTGQGGYQRSPGQQHDNLDHQPRPAWSPQHHEGMNAEGGGVGAEMEQQTFNCPKCGEICPDLDTLQIHVIDCIEEN